MKKWIAAATLAFVAMVPLSSFAERPDPVILNQIGSNQQRFNPKTVSFKIVFTGPSFSWGLGGSMQLRMLIDSEPGQYWSDSKDLLLVEHGHLFFSYKDFTDIQDQFESTRDYARDHQMDFAVPVNSPDIGKYDAAAVPRADSVR